MESDGGEARRMPRTKRRDARSTLTHRWRKPDSNFWSLNQSSSAVLTPDAMAAHTRHVCFRRAPRINPARDSAIASGQPHPQRKGRSASSLTPGAARASRMRMLRERERSNGTCTLGPGHAP
jgi:hypothetical protein